MPDAMEYPEQGIFVMTLVQSYYEKIIKIYVAV